MVINRRINKQVKCVEVRNCHFFVYSYCACACTCIHVGVRMLVCFLTNSSPPSTISISLPLSFPRSPLSLWYTDSDQVVLPLCSPQCGQGCCLLNNCSKLEEAAELLLYIAIMFCFFFYDCVHAYNQGVVLMGWATSYD